MTNRKSTTWSLAVSLLLLAVLAAVAFAISAQEKAHPDESAVAVGRATFRSYCASCHGPEAHGDGPVADYLKVKPADLTLIAQRNKGEFPFEMVTKIIDGREKVAGHGSPDMPVWGEAFRQTRGGEDEAAVKTKIEQLAHFLWSIQEKKQ